MSKYQLLRDSMQELKREASEKGGSNPRAQMICELIADYEAMQAIGASTRSKYNCASCGLNAWAKPSANLICGDCQETMEAV